ncbi:hypothetical protein GCM10008968_26840 [Bacillus horti]
MQVAFFVVLVLVNIFVGYLLFLRMRAIAVHRRRIQVRLLLFSLGFWGLIAWLGTVSYFDQQEKLALPLFVSLVTPAIILAFFALQKLKRWLE